jgi:hypothetical protein
LDRRVGVEEWAADLRGFEGSKDQASTSTHPSSLRQLCPIIRPYSCSFMFIRG